MRRSTLLIHNDLFNALDPEVTRRILLKTYTEAMRGLSQLLARRYNVFYDRDAVLKALRLSLPIDRTTNIGQYMPICNSALCVGGNCWCRSRCTLVDLEMLWKLHCGRQVPDEFVDRATGILQLIQRIADSITRPKTDQVSGVRGSSNFRARTTCTSWLNRAFEKSENPGLRSDRASCDKFFLAG